MKQYSHIGLGGTFDHFHRGHQTFLAFAAEHAEFLTIGVTSDLFIANKKKYELSMEKFATRKLSVQNWCAKNHIACEVIELQDIYGPTLLDTRIEALCVTLESTDNAHKINSMRTEHSLATLPIVTASYFLNEDQQPLHAIDIRAGKTSRDGKIYAKILASDRTLTPTQRDFFAQPQGSIVELSSISDTRNQAFVAVVGDKTLESFILRGSKYNLGIYDFYQQRQELISDILQPLEPEISAVNPAGTLSAHLSNSIGTAIRQHCKHLFVQGEEDLATVALFLLLPLESKIYYGQPGVGIVEVVVSEQLKDRVYQILQESTT